MQRAHQLQIPLCLGNPQLGKLVNIVFFRLSEKPRGARSVLGTSLVLSKNFHPLLTQNLLQN